MTRDRTGWAPHPALTGDPVPLAGLVAVFHDGSGESHLLDVAAAALLARVRAGEPVEGAEAHLIDLLDAGLIVPDAAA